MNTRILICFTAVAIIFSSCRTRGDFGVEKLGHLSPSPAESGTASRGGITGALASDSVPVPPALLASRHSQGSTPALPLP